MKRFCLFLGLMLFAGATLLIARETLKVQFPAETGVFKPGPGVEIANAQCLVCHSVEYVTTQPALPRAFWASSLNKMQEKYGAMIPAGQVEPLVDYLTRSYGLTTNAGGVLSPIVSARPSPDSSQPADPVVVATKYGCLNCHNPTTKLVGPAYKDISLKYSADPDARSKIIDQIHNGGSGKWGAIIMPPFPMVTEEETRLLVDWILNQK